MINCIIVDDELHSHEILKWKIEKIGADVKIMECFECSERALEFLKSNKVDLVFLDIQMPHLNGLELLECLDEINFSVIFTTAFDEYALRAIKLSALDYLLKPIDINQLKLAMEKMKTNMNYKVQQNSFQNYLSNNSKDKQTKKISLATKESIEFVDIASIVVCSSKSNYTQICFLDGHTKLISKTLKDFDELLTDFGFYRSHHSHLININHIKEFVRKDGGYLLMSNDIQIPIASNKKEKLFKLLVE